MSRIGLGIYDFADFCSASVVLQSITFKPMKPTVTCPALETILRSVEVSIASVFIRILPSPSPILPRSPTTRS